MDDRSKDTIFKNIILISLSVVMIAILSSQYMTPTIGNVFPSPLDGISLDWNCVERNGCGSCSELFWDTGWCSDCINNCELSDAEIRQKKTQDAILLSGVAILPALIFFVTGIKVEQDKSKSQLFLSIILFVLGITIFLRMKP